MGGTASRRVWTDGPLGLSGTLLQTTTAAAAAVSGRKPHERRPPPPYTRRSAASSSPSLRALPGTAGIPPRVLRHRSARARQRAFGERGDRVDVETGRGGLFARPRNASRRSLSIGFVIGNAPSGLDRRREAAAGRAGPDLPPPRRRTRPLAPRSGRGPRAARARRRRESCAWFAPAGAIPWLRARRAGARLGERQLLNVVIREPQAILRREAPDRTAERILHEVEVTATLRVGRACPSTSSGRPEALEGRTSARSSGGSGSSRRCVRSRSTYRCAEHRAQPRCEAAPAAEVAEQRLAFAAASLMPYSSA